MSQSGDILKLQDANLASMMNSLNNDPAKLNSFITKRKADVFNSVTKEHSDNFQKAYGDFTRASDGTTNIMYYHTRNKDLDNTQKAVFDKTKSEADAITFDSQNAKRQFEMNEWTANNKMDTLFFFQLLLIVLTLTAPLLYATKIGLIPSSVYYGVSGLIGIAVVLTLIVRAQYSLNKRDTRFWNRRRFASMGGPPTTVSCDALSSLATDAQNSLQFIEDNGQSTIKRGMMNGMAGLQTYGETVANNLG